MLGTYTHARHADSGFDFLRYRPWGDLGPDVCCTDIDVIEFKSQQHQGARSRHCLKAGTGSYVWHLSVDSYSSCTWIGLVKENADMSRSAFSEPAWLPQPGQHGWICGNSRRLANLVVSTVSSLPITASGSSCQGYITCASNACWV